MDGTLQLELDALHKRVQQCNDTIVSQANELTILRNIICRRCKHKFLDATLALSPSPGRSVDVLLNLPSASTSVVSSSSNALSIPTHCEVPNSQSPHAQPISSSSSLQSHEGTFTPPILAVSHYTPPFRTTGTTPQTHNIYTLQSPSAISHPQSQFRKTRIPDSHLATRPIFTTNSQKLIPPSSSTPLSGPPSRSSSSQVIYPVVSFLSSIKPVPTVPRSRNLKSDAVSFGDTTALPGDPEHNPEPPWSVPHGLNADKMLDVTLVRVFVHDENVYCVKFSFDGKYVAVGLPGRHLANRNLDGKVFVYNTETGEQDCLLVELTQEEKSLGARAMCFNPNGKQLAIGHFDGHISLWLLSRKRVRNMFRHHQTKVISLDFSPDGRCIVSASMDKTVLIWNVRDGSLNVLKAVHVMALNMYQSVKFSPNGRYIATANMDGLKIWDSRSHRLVVKWQGREGIASLAFMPDGKGLVGGSFDRSVKYWHVTLNGNTPTMRDPVNLHQFEDVGFVTSMAIAADGQWLLTGLQDRTPRLLNVSNSTRRYNLHGHHGSVLSVDTSHVGNFLAIGDSKGQVSLWKYKLVNGNQG